MSPAETASTAGEDFMLRSFMAEHSPNARVQQPPEIGTADFVGDQNDWCSRSSGDHARHGFEIRFREHDVGGVPTRRFARVGHPSVVRTGRDQLKARVLANERFQSGADHGGSSDHEDSSWIHA